MSTVADATSDINANPPWVETHGYIQTSLRDKETRLRRHPILTHSVTALTAVTPVMGIDLVPGVTGPNEKSRPGERPVWVSHIDPQMKRCGGGGKLMRVSLVLQDAWSFLRLSQL